MEPEEDIHFQNELKKLKLQAEHGMVFGSQMGEDEIPPEILRDFLDRVETFENNIHNSSPTTVGALLDHPVWRPESEISDAEIGAALQEIFVAMEAKGIALNILHPTPDRDVYRFITTELLLKEADDFGIPGMTQNYIYEEFYPNHREDIRELCGKFLKYFFDKNREEFGDWYLTAQMRSDQTWQNFRDAFDRFELATCRPIALDIDGDLAIVKFAAVFSGHLKGDSECVAFAGEGELQVKCSENWWQIASVTFPGKVMDTSK